LSNPDPKENRAKVATEASLPKLSLQESFTSSGPALPARPAATTNYQTSEASQKTVDDRLAKLERSLITDIGKHRIEDLAVLVAKTEQERKAVLSNLFVGQEVDRDIMALAEAILKIAANTTITAQVGSGSISRDSIAENLLHYISQQRTFDCTSHEIAMLDSLEFHLMRILATVNPTHKLVVQKINEEANTDDDSGDGGGGAEKAEEEEEGASSEVDSETDDDLSTSPRSKKGKARARARAKKSRYRKWLARMLRAFRRQSTLQKNRNRVTNSNQIRQKSQRDSLFLKTVRVFGRVTDINTGEGVGGIKLISNSMGDVVTSPDGSYAFENVTHGIHYSIAPLKAGSTFSPISINDIALDSREHNFKLIF
jgi:hypothetical protein